MIGHRITDDGVLVTLKQSWGRAVATLSETDAKRFAWGLLADLDPDGVEKLPAGSAHAAGCATEGLRGWRAGESMPRVRPQGSVIYGQACDAKLIEGYKAGLSYDAIGKSMKPQRTKGSVCGRINRLRDAGVIT